ncbi:hypothetical protein BKA63DRAFT_501646 [Paraphoma chrysanthemicola]|nr:hypothetical protein BKA63DRAFT_501646 [Paraphoma chrysanthemicola]
MRAHHPKVYCCRAFLSQLLVRQVACDLRQSNGDTIGTQRLREVHERVDMSHDTAMTARMFSGLQRVFAMCIFGNVSAIVSFMDMYPGV